MVRFTVLSALALALTVYAAGPDPSGAKNVGNGKGQQFITGQCLSNADCASACCAQQNGGVGVCSGVGAQFQAGKTGCGFVDPNNKANNGTNTNANVANGNGNGNDNGKKHNCAKNGGNANKAKAGSKNQNQNDKNDQNQQ